MSSFLAEEIREARSKGHTNLYLNYHRLSEIPQDLLALSKIKRLYLRRNSLKRLVISISQSLSDKLSVLLVAVLVADRRARSFSKETIRVMIY